MLNNPDPVPRSRILLIINSLRLKTQPHALDRIVRELGRAFDIRMTEHPGHAAELAREQARNYSIVAAVGGDGTVSDVANGLIASGSASALLPIPLGTGNDFARAVGIQCIDDAMRALRSVTTREVDAIEINCQTEEGLLVTRYSILTAGVAFGAEVIRRTDDRVKRLFGSRAAYSVGLFLALASYSPPRLRISNQQRAFDGRMIFVSVGNAESAGGGTMRLSPGAKIDDGQFDVCVFDVTSKLRVMLNFVHILKGTHVFLPEVSYFPANELEIESDPPSPLMIDGEMFGCTPAAFRIRRRAVRVMQKAPA